MQDVKEQGTSMGLGWRCATVDYVLCSGKSVGSGSDLSI